MMGGGQLGGNVPIVTRRSQSVDATPSDISLLSKGGVIWGRGNGLDFLRSRRTKSGVVGRPGRHCMRSGARLWQAT